MSRPSSIETHPARKEIEQALLVGESYGTIAKRYGTNKAVLHRHRQTLPTVIARGVKPEEIERADTLLDQVRKLQAEASSVLDTAKSAGDLQTALKAIAQARACIELLAKLTGELAAQPTINLTVNPVWIETRTVILAALASHPEARADVVKALEAVQS
jgi:hypothetical protein